MRDRAAAMRARVLARLTKELVTHRDIHLVDCALSAALELRDAILQDDHDIDALHPARTVLILLDDANIRDAHLLAAAALLESHDAAHVVPPDVVTHIDPAFLAAVTIPTPLTVAPDELVERLLSLTQAQLTVALAERLDHARHLHLRAPDVWPTVFALERDIYVPLAERALGIVGQRYGRWYSAFSARVGR